MFRAKRIRMKEASDESEYDTSLLLDLNYGLAITRDAINMLKSTQARLYQLCQR